MKVLLHADAVGGVFTYALELARALRQRGVEVVLATEGAPLDAAQARAVAAVPGLRHHGAAFRLEWMEAPWADVAAAGRWLLALERAEQPDVVQLGSFTHGALPFRAPALVVAHSCVPSWFEAVRGEPAPAAWDTYRRAVRRGLLCAAAVVAPSRAMAEALVRHHGPLPPPRVIPNARDPARFPPGPGGPLVMGAGRLWDEAKGAAALAAAAPALPWPVAIAGDPAPPAPAPAPGPATPGADAPGAPLAPGQAHRLGRLDEASLARWLGRASIFAHPARYEPFGLAVLEAALAGCALVLGDVPSLREFWDGAARFVPPGQPAPLALALRALIGDARGRARLAAAARARALRLSPARQAQAYLDLYGALCRQRTGAHP
ncbi:MAG: glycosyltransferase family 4 protein [Anaeromyxobacter sp.]